MNKRIDSVNQALYFISRCGCMQTTIRRCRAGSTAGCIAEIALQVCHQSGGFCESVVARMAQPMQVGSNIFRANSTGTFLQGKRVSKEEKAAFPPGSVRRSGNDVEVCLVTAKCKFPYMSTSHRSLCACVLVHTHASIARLHA